MSESKLVGHLPVARAYLDRIKLVETVNRLVPCRMKVDPGTLMAGLVLNVLVTRHPLYRLEEFYRGVDCQGLLGVDATAMSDDNVGRALDRVYRAGTWKVLSEVGLNARQEFGLDLSEVHHDTTSRSVQGEYEESAEGPVHLTYGHSKDKRPDLKQFVVSVLCAEKNIPIHARICHGNEADKKINGRLLDQLGGVMAAYGVAEREFIYVSDSALVTEENLARLTDTLFVTRLPANYGECGRLVTEAVKAGAWTELGPLAEAPPAGHADLRARYRAWEGAVTLHGRTHRAVVVHSDAHDRRRRKKIARNIQRDLQTVQARLAELSRRKFACAPDARQMAAAVQARYHRVDFEVVARPVYRKGRPSKDGPRAVARTEYAIQAEARPDAAAITRLEEEAGCFVLLTNVPREQKEARELLVLYKEQDGIEKCFGFLKDPLIVNDLFLHSSHRIEAMGLVLVLALMVDRLMQREMRRRQEAADIALQGWKKRPTRKPTVYMLRSKFAGLMVVVEGRSRRLAAPLNGVQLNFLLALGVDAKVFVTPSPPPARPARARA